MKLTFRICVVLMVLLCSCAGKDDTAKMQAIFQTLDQQLFHPDNFFNPDARLQYFDSLISTTSSSSQLLQYEYSKASVLLSLGREQDAISLFRKILPALTPRDSNFRKQVISGLALSYLRSGERTNCIESVAAASCIMPIKGAGIYHNHAPTKQAISLYEELLQQYPTDFESKWLLNFAYMTIAGYPDKVPRQYLIPGLNEYDSAAFTPFYNIAPELGVAHKGMAGGVIIDDFNNDGYPDIVTSEWSIEGSVHYYKNNTDGSFSDASDASGLSKVRGGLNMIQADYNNDGFTDILLLRGAWRGKFGRVPNSLLRNNGDGTFSDVTISSGLLSFHPTQTAAWSDFNNDGWIDLFIGNESNTALAEIHPCELYLNNANGTFTNIALEANINIIDFVKGVTAGDYNNDHMPDIFLSCMTGRHYLFQNNGMINGKLSFTDVTGKSGLNSGIGRTFPAWFWDYDNDGWSDIFTCDYEFEQPLSYYAALEALIPEEQFSNTGKPYLLHNNRDGSFTNMVQGKGMAKVSFAMGANFGDINNDGYPDVYLGTGNISLKSVIPNKMFLNLGGKDFADITAPSRTGNIQKGHGVAFADLDEDGDQDIFIVLGGAFPGDAYPDALYINNHSPEHNWIKIQLRGTTSNRAAIGARLKLTITENGVQRVIFCDVNSGGSFGANPLRKEIGLGNASVIDSLQVTWPGGKRVQVFTSVKANQVLTVTEGNNTIEQRSIQPLVLKNNKGMAIPCGPEMD